jgi:hypothetical protein
MSPRRPRTDELWRGYRRPVRSDRALWVAIGLTAIVVIIEFALSSPTTPLGWVAFGLIALALAVLVVSLVGVAAGVFRGFSDGWRSNRSKSPGRQSTPSAPAASAEPAPAPKATASDDRPPLPRPAVPDSVKNLAAAAQAHKPTSADVDRTARALGRAAGAARRAYRKPD